MKRFLSVITVFVLLCTSSVYFAGNAEVECTNHTKGTLISEKAPTCTEEGVNVYACSVCGKQFNEIVPMLAHEHAAGAIPSDSKAATCTAEGWLEYTCIACGQVYKEATPMTDHDVTTVVTEASCTAPKTIVYDCKNCDYTKTVTEGEALGHIFTDDLDLEAKCAEAGIILDPVKDLLVYTHEDATCAEPGFDGSAYYCVRCGKYKDNIVTPIAQLTHGDEFYGLFVMEADIDGNEHCVGSTQPEGLTELDAMNGYGKITCDYKAATCTEGGYVTVSCDKCGLTETRAIEALGHIWHDDMENGDFQPTKKWWIDNHGHITWHPNCMLNGMMEFTCDRCGETYTVEMLARGHHDFGKEWSLKQYWQMKYLDREIQYCGSNLGGLISVAPCMDYIIYNWCADCDEYEVLNMEGNGEHDWELNIVAEKATCTEKGLALYECANCQTPKFIETEALGHSWDNGTVTTAPTCTEDGVRTFKCTRPGCTATKTEAIPTNGHTKIKVDGKAATCTTNGYYKEICLACGAVVKDEVIPAHHTYDPDNVDAITLPTCTKDGFVNYTCTICCAVVEHEVIPALGHDLVENVTPATCQSAEKHVLTCSRCNHEEIFYVGEPLAHDINNATKRIVYKQETCEDDGLAYYECGDCGEMFEGIIPATGHNFVTTWDGENQCWVNRCVNPGCDKVVTIEYKTPSYSIDTSRITVTSIKTSGVGSITLDEMCQPLKEAYIRITWSYTLKDGDSLSFVACVPVRDDGTFKANGPSAPAGSLLNSTLMIVVDNADADDQDLSSVRKYGNVTLK